MNGLTLTFHLAGINNQNFLMRDEETGTFWQQVSGLAVSGPLKGQSLRLISSDELTFALWTQEQPGGQVLKDVPAYVEQYAGRDWDVKMRKQPVVVTFARKGIKDRDLMYGIQAFGEARAWPAEMVLREGLVRDRLGSEPVMLVVGPDGKSVRAFRARVPGTEGSAEFYRTQEGMIDSGTGSHWNFQGCATEGSAKGACLERLNMIADYWFAWRYHNPQTTLFSKPN